MWGPSDLPNAFLNEIREYKNTKIINTFSFFDKKLFLNKTIKFKLIPVQRKKTKSFVARAPSAESPMLKNGWGNSSPCILSIFWIICLIWSKKLIISIPPKKK